MPQLTDHRWLLIGDGDPAWGWTRTPRPHGPRLHLRSLSGPPMRVYLEDADRPGVRRFMPGPEVPAEVVHQLGCELALVQSMVESQWLDDCIADWGWVSAGVVDGHVAVTVYEGTEREFTRVVEAVHPGLTVAALRVLPRPPRVVVEVEGGEAVVVPLVGSVFLDR